MKTRRGSAARVGVEQSRAANAQQAIHFWFIKFTRKCGANFRRFGAQANRKIGAAVSPFGAVTCQRFRVWTFCGALWPSFVGNFFECVTPRLNAHPSPAQSL